MEFLQMIFKFRLNFLCRETCFTLFQYFKTKDLRNKLLTRHNLYFASKANGFY